MTDTKSRLIPISILLLMLAASYAAVAAPPVKVETATPSEAEQQTTGLEITIGGSGFDTAPGAVTSVKFLLPCDTEPCTDTGGVEVTTFTVPSRKTIIATVSIDEFADVDFRDIEVQMTNGRGGKGTTLFSVREKDNGNNSPTETCNKVFFGIERGQPGPCMALNRVDECELGVGNPERIKNMTMDCSTTETLFLPVTNQLNSLGNIESDDDNYSLTAIAPFVGTSVIANAGHRATVRQVNIVIDSSVTNVGCGPDALKSAVRFILDKTTEPPFLPGDEFNEGRATVFGVDHSFVITEGAPLCEAIVFERETGYTSLYPTTNDWKVGVAENNIAPGSYIKTGIRYQGFKQQQDINPPYVIGNVVGFPDCLGAGSAVGISYGPLVARDFDPSSEALIEGNMVTMSGAMDCTFTMGILLFGDSDTDMDGQLNNNAVTGGDVGVAIDASSSTDSVNMKGNTLTGEGGAAAVSSDICVEEKGKPNLINGAWGIDYDLPSFCDGQ